MVVKYRNVEFHVKVKGVTGTQAEFIITKNEVARAKDDPLFKLAVVVGALTSKAKILEMTGAEFLSEYSFHPIQYMARLKSKQTNFKTRRRIK